MSRKHYPEMKSAERIHMRLRKFHKKRMVDQKIQTKNKFVSFRPQ